jgi:hypothetical protein
VAFFSPGINQRGIPSTKGELEWAGATVRKYAEVESHAQGTRGNKTTETVMNISRRHLLKAAPAAAGTIGCAILAKRAQAEAMKAPKSAVRYQGGPRGEQSCALCANFLPPSDCRVVASPVTPNAWCLLFQPKSAAS